MKSVPLWQSLIIAAVASKTGVTGKPEQYFAKPRMWRFDIAWPEFMVAFEREGMAKKGSKLRHTTFTGYTNDCEKYNAAAIQGWCVIRATAPMIESGEALASILEAIKAKGGKR